MFARPTSDAWSTIADKLGDDAVADLVVATDEGPDLIPAHPGLDTLDSELGNIDDARDRYSRLEQFLDEYVDPLGYEVVLVDLPGMTNNVSYKYNGLWAARHIINEPSASRAGTKKSTSAPAIAIMLSAMPGDRRALESY